MNTYQICLDDNIINRNISYMQIQEDAVELCNSQNIVLNIIRSHSKKGGITDQEIASIAEMSLSSVNARRNELMRMGLISSNGSINYCDDYGKTRYRTLWISK